MPATVLLIPGLNDSGPHHWQSLWHAANPGFVRVVQRDWETPDRAEWVAALAGRLVLAVVVMALLAVVLALCSEADAFVDAGVGAALARYSSPR